MPNPSETFGFAYQVSKSGSTYTVVDSDGTTPKVDPLDTKVDIVDPNGDDGKIAPNDGVRVHDTKSDLLATGKYTYVGTASLDNGGGNGSGFVITDGSGNFFYITDDKYTGNLKNGNGTLTVDTHGITTVCFMPGTMIATPDGAAAVETLDIGQLVLTLDGEPAPIRWIGRQTVIRFFAGRNLPIRVKAHAIDENVPARDLLVSPAHALLVDGVLTQAGALVNGLSIVQERDVPATFVYYHVELDDHSLILAENVPAETFVDNVERAHFDNWSEHEALYPAGKSVMEMELPRAKAYRQVPKAVRERLSARAKAMFEGSAVSAA